MYYHKVGVTLFMLKTSLLCRLGKAGLAVQGLVVQAFLAAGQHPTWLNPLYLRPVSQALGAGLLCGPGERAAGQPQIQTGLF